jgi:hypothetical protein
MICKMYRRNNTIIKFMCFNNQFQCPSSHGFSNFLNLNLSLILRLYSLVGISFAEADSSIIE